MELELEYIYATKLLRNFNDSVGQINPTLFFGHSFFNF